MNKNLVISIDPGNVESGFIVSNIEKVEFVYYGKWENSKIRELIKSIADEIKIAIIEIPVIFGRANTVRDTILETGRFIQYLEDLAIYHEEYPRRTVLAYYSSPKKLKKDAEMAAYKSTDARMRLVCRRKFNEAMLKNISKDMWQALVLLAFWFDKQDEEIC